MNIWYSGDEQNHEFASVSEVGDWIANAKNPSILAASFPSRTVRLTIGGPTKQEGTVAEFSSGPTQEAIYDRATAIRAWLARLEELSA